MGSSKRGSSKRGGSAKRGAVKKIKKTARKASKKIGGILAALPGHDDTRGND